MLWSSQREAQPADGCTHWEGRPRQVFLFKLQVKKQGHYNCPWYLPPGHHARTEASWRLTADLLSFTVLPFKRVETSWFVPGGERKAAVTRERSSFGCCLWDRSDLTVKTICGSSFYFLVYFSEALKYVANEKKMSNHFSVMLHCVCGSVEFL